MRSSPSIICCRPGPLVSHALDGKCGLLGEVKWSEQPVRPADLRRVAGELRRKGVPPALSEGIARYLRHLGLPTEVPPMAPARGPPFWQSRVLRRRYGEPPDPAEA